MANSEKYKSSILAASTRRIQLTKVSKESHQLVDDELAVEEPLEIQLAFGKGRGRQTKKIAVTMRTPGQDRELALGFLFTEGIISDRKDVANVRYTGQQFDEQLQNSLVVDLMPDIEVDMTRLERHFYTTSSCGVCGKRSIEMIAANACYAPLLGKPVLSKEIIFQWPAKIREAQAVFKSTGGLHAAALFDEKGDLLALREDIGRHNALDKLLGMAFLKQQIPLYDKMLMVSGRASFELIQKALMVGLPIVAAVGAPSSLAVELAEEQGMTLVGFLKENKFNIYTASERIILA